MSDLGWERSITSDQRKRESERREGETFTGKL